MASEFAEYPRINLVETVIIVRATGDEKRDNRPLPFCWFFTEWDGDHRGILIRIKMYNLDFLNITIVELERTK